MTWAALCCVVAAVLLGGAPRRHPGLDRVLPAGTASGRAGRRAGRRRHRGTGPGVEGLGGRGPGAAREATRLRGAVVLLAEALATELRSGADPRAALTQAAGTDPLLAEVAARARSPAGDVPAALRELSRRPGAEAAGDLAVLWSVCETSGAGLAAPVSRLAGGLRDDEQVRREVAAQLAGPRTTAWLLAGLPAFGLLIGAALGARPWALLTGAAGPLLVVPGVGLEVVGLVWTRALTRRALRS